MRLRERCLRLIQRGPVSPFKATWRSFGAWLRVVTTIGRSPAPLWFGMRLTLGVLTASCKSGKIAADARDTQRRCGPTSKLMQPSDHTARRTGRCRSWNRSIGLSWRAAPRYSSRPCWMPETPDGAREDHGAERVLLQEGSRHLRRRRGGAHRLRIHGSRHPIRWPGLIVACRHAFSSPGPAAGQATI